ncbi:MAG: pentapeptide repeat-containing protein [Kiritimatiellae bacterium]|nr:pentapeptide repeat-containing protein [Kiritimatiellia bacterium]
MKRLTCQVLAIATFAVSCLVCAAPVALKPGDQTDPSAGKPAATSTPRGYEPAEEFRVPYVSTYYVQPIVTSSVPASIKFYVTDWDQSEIRHGDDSWRFTAHVRLVRSEPTPLPAFSPSKKGVKKTASKTKKLPKPKPAKKSKKQAKGGANEKTVADLSAGDNEIDLGTLSPGDYDVCLWCTDQKGRESHRVWQQFRVRDAAELEITAERTYAMTEKDLETYKIKNDDHRERLAPSGGAAPKPADPKQPGYVVSYPSNGSGIPVTAAFEQRVVKYDPGYDKDAVEAEALQTTKGLDEFLADKAAEGYRKVVLLPGTYRLSAKAFISMPDYLTVDMNGATFKENGFTGCHATMVRFESTDDAHLVNGTIAGDYWEHDYEHSEHKSEWPMGVSIDGECRYSGIENLKIVDVTGYGGGNGVASDRRGGMARYSRPVKFTEPGELDRKTGKVNRSVKGRVTSDFIDVTGKDCGNWVQLCKFLGYQGRSFREWCVTVCFYSVGKRLVGAETAWQYRKIRIPDEATYLRVSVDCPNVLEANKAEFTASDFRMPYNCTVANCNFTHVRCVGYAASAMRNFRFKDNAFIRCGEALAMSSFDAEDGWDMMQDTYMDGNKFWASPFQTDIVTCCGHNFVFERNVGRIYMWERTFGSVARNNSGINGVFRCGSRRSSGYARATDTNDWPYGLELGVGGKTYADWDFAMRGLKFGPGKKLRAPVTVGVMGRLVDCTFQDMAVGHARLTKCRMKNCVGRQPRGGEWDGCEMHNMTFTGSGGENSYVNCKFVKCSLKHVFSGKMTLRNCTFKKCAFENCEKAAFDFVDCTFDETELPKE